MVRCAWAKIGCNRNDLRSENYFIGVAGGVYFRHRHRRVLRAILWRWSSERNNGVKKYGQDDIDRMHARIDAACDKTAQLEKERLDDITVMMIGDCRRAIMHAVVNAHVKGAKNRDIEEAVEQTIAHLLLVVIDGLIPSAKLALSLTVARKMLAGTADIVLRTLMNHHGLNLEKVMIVDVAEEEDHEDGTVH
jgi:hypothetical protein